MNEKTFFQKYRRWAIGALALAGLAVLVFAVYRPRALPVEVAVVSIGTFEQAIDEDGHLRLKSRYVITAPTQAALLRPSLKVGDAIKAGDVVATLEPVAPQMIDARTRGVLQQRVGSAEAARHAANAQVQRAQTALAQVTLEAERATKLAQESFISPAARDQAQLARQAAQQALAAAQAEQGVADYALNEARAALARAEPAAARPAQRWNITSPVDGQVIKLHQDSAVNVVAGQPLLEIGNTAALEAVVDVLSSAVGQVSPGAPVRLSTGGDVSPLAGHVTRVEPVAFTKVSALGIEEQRVNVIVDLDAGGAGAASAVRLGDGYRVDAHITVAARPGVLLVPTAALVRDGTQWRVFVLIDGRARARAVQLQDRNAEVAWLKEGLREGDTVVLYPGSMVKDGQALRVR